jgi:hypothetical protein
MFPQHSECISSALEAYALPPSVTSAVTSLLLLPAAGGGGGGGGEQGGEGAERISAALKNQQDPEEEKDEGEGEGEGEADKEGSVRVRDSVGSAGKSCATLLLDDDDIGEDIGCSDTTQEPSQGQQQSRRGSSSTSTDRSQPRTEVSAKAERRQAASSVKAPPALSGARTDPAQDDGQRLKKRKSPESILVPVETDTSARTSKALITSDTDVDRTLTPKKKKKPSIGSSQEQEVEQEVEQGLEVGEGGIVGGEKVGQSKQKAKGGGGGGGGGSREMRSMTFSGPYPFE